MSAQAWGALVTGTVVICATVAGALDALSGEALAGVYGGAIGGGVGFSVGRSRRS